MQGTVLTQTFGFVNAVTLEPHGTNIVVPREAQEYGYMLVPCNEGCYGTGLFEIRKGDVIECTSCKGTGMIWVNVN